MKGEKDASSKKRMSDFNTVLSYERIILSDPGNKE